MTKLQEAATAKNFGDAHERSAPNPKGERIMDLHNNQQGRKLAESTNDTVNDIEAVLDALRNGQLKTTPPNCP